MSALTRRARKAAIRDCSSSGVSLLEPTMRVRPRARTALSMPPATVPKNGLPISGMTRPIAASLAPTRMLRAIRLGW